MKQNIQHDRLRAGRQMTGRMLSILVILSLTCRGAFAQERIAFVKDRDVLQVALLAGGKPFYTCAENTPAGKKFFAVNGDTPSEAYDYIGRLLVSADGSVVVFKVRIGDDWYVMNGAQRIGPYSKIEEPVFLKDSNTAVFIANQNEKVFVVVGNTKYTIRDGTESDRDFALILDKFKELSPVVMLGGITNIGEMLVEGKAFVYAKFHEGKTTILYGNQELGPFDFARSFIEGPKGDEVAFTALVDGKTFVVSGQNRYGPYDAVTGLRLTPKKDKLAYVADIGGSFFAFLGSERIGPFDEIALEPLDFQPGGMEARTGLLFTPDGASVVFRARKGNAWYISGNGVQYGPYDRVDSGMAFSPDGSSLVYGAMTENRWYAVHDGKAEGPYDRIGFDESGYDPDRSYSHLSAFRFDSDGKTLLYPVKKANKTYLVAGSKEFGPYDFITELSLSDEGGRFAAVLGIDGSTYVLNTGKLEGQSDSIDTPNFSRDGTVLSYVSETDDRSYFVRNGNRFGPYDIVGIAGISRTGSVILYQALKGGEWNLMDGSGRPLFAGFFIPEPVAFSPEGTGFAAVIESDSREYLVTSFGTFGPYVYVWDSPVFSQDGGALGFTCLRDAEVRQCLFRDGALRTGSIRNGIELFVEDGAIYRR